MLPMLRGAPDGLSRGRPRAAGAAPPLRARAPRRPQRPSRTDLRGAWARLHGGTEPRSWFSPRGGRAGGGTEHPASVRDGVTYTAGQNPATPQTPNTAGTRDSSPPAAGAGRGKWRRESGDGERGGEREGGGAVRSRRAWAGGGGATVCAGVCVHVCLCSGACTAGRTPVPAPRVPAHACVTLRRGSKQDPPGPALGLGRGCVVNFLNPSPRSCISPVGFEEMG